MTTSKTLATLAVIGLVASISSTAQAAIIYWNAPADTASFNDIITAGSPVASVNEGSNALVVDPGGINMPFTTASDFPAGIFSAAAPGVNTGDANFNAILDQASYSLTNPAALTVGGLTTGENYQVQLFYTDTRGCCNTRMQTYTAGNSSAAISASGSGNGQYVVGTFTADAATQDISVSSSANAPTLNAYVVRQVAGAPLPLPTGILGNTVRSRGTVGDASTGVFWTNAFGAPVAGSVDSVDFFFQGDTRTFELFQLRPTGTANQFDVIARSGLIAPSGTPYSKVSATLPNGPFDLEPGDMLAHYGQGLPFDIDLTAPDAHNSRYIYYNSPSAPGVGSNITLGGTGFPLFNQRRDYAWAVQMDGFIETVGNGAGPAGPPDGAPSLLVVMDNDPFTQVGRIDTWQFFNDTAGTGGRLITPVTLRDTANGLEVLGIGTTRVGTENGFQQYDFGLVEGSLLVEAGDLFGFYYGDGQAGNHQGSVQYTQVGSDNIRLISQNLTDGLQISDVFTAVAYNVPRYYAANASTIVVPEPGTLTLLVLGGLGLVAYLRRRRPGR